MLRVVSIIALSVALAGCHFGRTVVNAHVRDIDTSWIEPGKTTRAEVVQRIGMPPTVKSLGGVRNDSFRWVMIDTDERILEAGWILTPTFERTRERYTEDIFIKFDDHDVVTLVSRTHSDGETVKIVELREAKR